MILNGSEALFQLTCSSAAVNQCSTMWITRRNFGRVVVVIFSLGTAFLVINILRIRRSYEFTVNGRDVKELAADLKQVTISAKMASTKSPSASSVDKSRAEIERYLQTEQKRCSSHRRHNQCPCVSPYLEGRLTLNLSEDGMWSELYSTVGRDLLAGGEWRPLECTAHTRLAVIIPCRDRDQHLRIMLRHLIPILQRQLTHFRIFVVEQNSPAVFNKAAMMNIGFMEAMKMFPNMNCVIFHDVDLLLEDDRMLMNCHVQQPHHYVVALDRWNYTLRYKLVVGGVVSMTPAQYRQVNGYSPIYFGWGGEDDDMGIRVLRLLKHVYRPPTTVGRYTMLKHDRDFSNPIDMKRHDLVKTQYRRYRQSTRTTLGMSNTRYSLNDKQLRPLYTWIHADLNVTGLPYPKHVSHVYRMEPGVCGEQLKSRELSLVTCQHMCDVDRLQKCIGFSYYFRRKQNSTSAVDATPSCVLLKSKCQSDKLIDDVIDGFTYVKL